LEETSGQRLLTAADVAAVEAAVRDGRADVGVVLRRSAGPLPVVEVLSGAGRDVAAAAATGRIEGLLARAAGSPTTALSPPAVTRRVVGPEGDVQAVYYAGAVSVMFVFFAAMHGAMGGLDERRSGLQARLALASGGSASILGGRAAWLVTVGVVQAAAVFAVAAPRLPPLSLWQAGAWLITATLTAAAAAGLALVVIGLCRTREQAQPLSTFIVLLLAALGGSMAPRFLMPETFRQLGWITPHAWAIEAYQTVLWRGGFNATVWGAWAVLGGVGLLGGLGAWVMDARRIRM
jgi:ABC-2 type transport system permease protein